MSVPRRELIALVLAVLVGSTGCDSTTPDTSVRPEAHGPGRTVSMLDTAGMPVAQTIAAPPHRVVVIGQNLVETLIDLGLTDRIVGIGYLEGTQSPHTEVIATLPKLADNLPSAESVLATHPNLILSQSFAMTEDDLGSIATWNALGIDVVLADNPAAGRTVHSFLADIHAVGVAFAVTARADARIAEQRRRLDRIRAVASTARARPRVLLVEKGGVGATYNYYPRSFGLVDDLVDISGGTYLEPFRDRSATLSDESIIDIAPEAIIITEFRRGTGAAGRAELLADQRLRTVPAVRNGRVLSVDYTTSIRGTLRLGAMAGDIAGFLHPDRTVDR